MPVMFSAVTSLLETRPKCSDQDQDQMYKTKTKTKTETARPRPALVWDRSCHKTTVSDHNTAMQQHSILIEISMHSVLSSSK